MKIGIIGTGMIATAIVTGFCTKKTGHEFFLSPRGAEKSAALAAKFSEAKVCVSNQDVLDNAEWVFISIQNTAFHALNELKFRKGHKVLNMSAEMQLTALRKIIGETALMAHVIPLPMIALGFGPILVYPEIHEVGDLFADVGDAFYAQSQEDARTLQLVTGMMSPYYMLLNEVVGFAADRGLERGFSIDFAHSLFSSMNRRAAEAQACDLIELAHDMTPGGYNEQSMKELMENGSIGAWRTALDRLAARIQRSGELPHGVFD